MFSFHLESRATGRQHIQFFFCGKERKVREKLRRIKCGNGWLCETSENHVVILKADKSDKMQKHRNIFKPHQQ